MANYPSVVTNFSTKVNGAVIDASDVNSIQTDVVAIETFIGTESSAVGTLFYDIRAASSAGGGHIQTANKGGTGQTTYTKGDILVASSASVLAKLAIGTDTQVLTADSTQTAGAKWAAPTTGEWTYISKLTFANSTTPQSITGIASHTLLKLIANLYNTSSTAGLGMKIQVNSVAGTAYTTLSHDNTAFSLAGAASSWNILNGANAVNTYIGETVINSSVLTAERPMYHTGGSTNNSDIIALSGHMTDTSIISKIHVTPNVAMTGTVELWSKDAQ